MTGYLAYSFLRYTTTPRRMKKFAMGMTIDKWGPGAWNTLHSFAHASPPVLSGKQQEELAQFLNSFGALLPCPACRRHFQAYMEAHVAADSFATRESVIRFLHDAHNDVNVRLRKRVWTLEEHYAAYAIPTSSPPWEAPNTTTASAHDTVVWWACTTVAAIVVAVVLVRRRRHAHVL